MTRQTATIRKEADMEEMAAAFPYVPLMNSQRGNNNTIAYTCNVIQLQAGEPQPGSDTARLLQIQADTIRSQQNTINTLIALAGELAAKLRGKNPNYELI